MAKPSVFQMVPCVICGASCCQIEGCSLPEHDHSRRLDDGDWTSGGGWVCSEECWDQAVEAAGGGDDDG